MSSILSFYGIANGALLLGALAAWCVRSVELRDRTVTLLVLLQIVSVSLYASDDSWRLFCVVLGVLALLEMAQCTGAHSYLLLLLISSLVLVGAHVEALRDHWPYGLAGVLAMCAWIAIGTGQGRSRQGFFFAWGSCFLIPAVVALVGSRSVSIDWVVILLLTTQANDMLGLRAGKFFGRRPFLPRISPNKTLEGFLAGGLGVIAAGVAARSICPSFQQQSWTSCALLLLALFLAANAGDLIFSRVKRCLDLKDFGHLLPGHGGVLDRADSLLLSAPALYTCLVLMGLVPGGNS